MKRQFALLFALTFLVSGMATIAEETVTDTEIAIVENAESESLEWVAPFEDGAWLSIFEWNAEMYLPTGWQLFEVTETGFSVTDPEQLSLVTVTMEDLLTEETAETEEATETEETAENTEATETEESAETTDAEVIEVSQLETIMMELGQEYELSMVGEREMAVTTGELNMTVRFLLGDKLITMDFTPVGEGSIADHALPIAGTFYVNEVEAETETAEITETVNTEAAAEETAAE